MKTQTLLAAGLVSLSAALPAADSSFQQTKPFWLSLTEQKNPNHNGLRMEIIHVGAAENVAVFRNPATYGTAAYLNDTRANIKGDHAYLQFDLGLPKGSPPYTMNVPAAKPKLQFVHVVPQMTTEEFYIARDASTGERRLALYSFEEGAAFYVCKTSFDGGQTHELALKYGGYTDFEAPKGCDVAHMAVSNVPKIDQ